MIQRGILLSKEEEPIICIGFLINDVSQFNRIFDGIFDDIHYKNTIKC